MSNSISNKLENLIQKINNYFETPGLENPNKNNLLEIVSVALRDINDNQQLMQRAYELVNGEKRKAYGDLKQSFENIAKVWTAILSKNLKSDVVITSEQVALCMAGLKLVREGNLHQEDNIIDLYGYTLCLEQLIGPKL